MAEQRVRRLEDVLERGESETLEFKASIPAPDALARNIAALANTRGGTIVLGLDERRTTILPVSKAKARNHYERARRLLIPEPDTHFYVVGSIRGSLVCIDVERAEGGPVSLGGVILRREGATSRPVHEGELRAMLHEQLNRDVPALQKETAENIAAVLANQSKLLEEIRKGQLEARTWRSRFPDILVSGVVGAVLGVLLSGLFL